MLVFGKIFFLGYHNIEFHIYVNMELAKSLLVHFYFVRVKKNSPLPIMSTLYNIRIHETEKLATTKYVNLTEYVLVF